MIERFNFYDVYGYLLPGAILLTLGALPFALSTWDLPSLEWTSAITFIVAGYVVGHFLQALARDAVPSTVRKDGKARFPSDIVLDEGDPTFPKEFKETLKRYVSDDFGLDASAVNQRQAVFNVCRQALQASDSPSYAEQFQGLYAFMRGIFAASLVMLANYLGWLVGSRFGPSWWVPGQVLVGAAVTVWLFTVLINRYGFWSLLLLAASAGALAGIRFPLTPTREFALGLAIPFLIVSAKLSRSAYILFAHKFATTVYEAYYVRQVVPTAKQ